MHSSRLVLFRRMQQQWCRSIQYFSSNCYDRGLTGGIYIATTRPYAFVRQRHKGAPLAGMISTSSIPKVFFSTTETTNDITDTETTNNNGSASSLDEETKPILGDIGTGLTTTSSPANIKKDSAKWSHAGKYHKSKNKSKRQKSKVKQKRKQQQQSQIQFLHFQQELHSKQTLENDFEVLANQYPLPKTTKWIVDLNKQLINELKRETKEVQNSTSSNHDYRRLWGFILDFFKRRQLPKEFKDIFFKRLVIESQGITKTLPEKNLVSQEEEIHQQQQKDVLLLHHARSLSVPYPMFWSRDYKRKIRKVLSYKKVIDKQRQSQQQEETQLVDKQEHNIDLSPTKRISIDDYIKQIRTPAIRTKHEQFTTEQQHEQAVTLQQLLQVRLTDFQYEKVIKYIQDYVDECPGSHDGRNDMQNRIEHDDIVVGDIEDLSILSNDLKELNRQSDRTETNHFSQLRVMKSSLEDCISKDRFHLVAEAFADYFYVSVPDDILTSVSAKHEQGINPVSNDTLLVASHKKWSQAKDKYVEAFTNIHQIVLDEYNKYYEIAEVNDVLPTDDNDSVIDSEITEASVLTTLGDVSSSNQQQMSQSTTERVRPRRYTFFEAIPIGPHAGSAFSNLSETNEVYKLPALDQITSSVFSSSLFPTEAPTDRIVIVDNLPIDINKGRLWDAYSRCGEIEDIEIFHSRPDLDPGRRSKDDKKRIRSPSSSSQRQRWRRPRTPLYGMILYKDERGAAKAASDPLRIFGMILDKHLIRSHPSTDMTRLYLEDLPSGHDISFVEYSLSRLLHPDLYVFLGSSLHRRQPRKNHNGMNCAIKFPSFDAAYWAYWKLSLELDFLKEDDNCSLHWMETPPDAMLYWTRQLNF